MKKVLLVTMALCMILVVRAQKSVIISNLTMGQLATRMSGKTGVTSLTITGEMNATDFSYFQTGNGAAITFLDLRGITKIDGDIIPKNAFGNGTGVTDLYLPDGVVKEFGPYSISSYKLVTVHFGQPKGGSYIFDEGCFSDLSSCKQAFIVPDGSTINGKGCFQFTGFTKITFPDSLNELTIPASIGDQAFNFFGCNNLDSVNIPKGVKDLGDPRGQGPAFGNCLSLQNVVLPATLKTIEVATFNGCTNLSQMTLPSGLTTINPYNTFSQCKNFSFSIPYSVGYGTDNQIGSNGTNGCYNFSGITSLQVPASVTAVYLTGTTQLTNLEFASGSQLTHLEIRNSGLEKIVVPEGVTAIGTDFGGFGNNSKLKYLELPSTLDAKAGMNYWGILAEDSALESIVINQAFPPDVSNSSGTIGSDHFQGITAFYGINKDKCVIYVPNTDAVAAYKTAPGWGDFKNIRVIGSDAKDQTITNFADTTVHVGSSPITLAATASSGSAVTYSIEAGKDSVATLSNGVLTIKGEGTATITATASGDGVDWNTASKTITLTVVDYSWLQDVAIAVEGNVARVVGPVDSIAKFTKFSINNTDVANYDNSKGVDISAAASGTVLKAANADGSAVIKLTYYRAPMSAAQKIQYIPEGQETIKLNLRK